MNHENVEFATAALALICERCRLRFIPDAIDRRLDFHDA